MIAKLMKMVEGGDGRDGIATYENSKPCGKLPGTMIKYGGKEYG